MNLKNAFQKKINPKPNEIIYCVEQKEFYSYIKSSTQSWVEYNDMIIFQCAYRDLSLLNENVLNIINNLEYIEAFRDEINNDYLTVVVNTKGKKSEIKKIIDSSALIKITPCRQIEVS